MTLDIKQISIEVEQKSGFVRDLMGQWEKVIIGQKEMLERLLIGILCNGHVLIDGVPGLAKTLTVTTMAKSIKSSFQRL